MPDHRADDRRPAVAEPLRAPDLDRWLPAPALTVTARRESDADPARLWQAATAVPLGDTGLLGRLIRWRIPGTTAGLGFGELFREPPFVALEEREHCLISGLAGRIWTLRRDYPELAGADAFRRHAQRGTARVLFAHWIEPAGDGRCALVSEARVEAIGIQGRLGVAAVRPLVLRFGHLVGSEGLAAAVRRAEAAKRRDEVKTPGA